MNFIGIGTLLRREFVRTLRVPLQTLGQPVISALLYFLVMGFAVGQRIGTIGGVSYTEFIMPGLIMMNLLITSFFSISSALMLSKMMNTLSDLLVTPMSYLEIVIGYTLSSVVRSVMVAVLIYAVAVFFIPFRIEHPFYLLSFTLIVAEAFALLGLIAGIWADTFEQVTILPTFLITPLTFLGGVFYSIEMLPPFARILSHFNPFFYLISGMRYGFYGVSDVNHWAAFGVGSSLLVALGAVSWIFLRTGYKIRH